MFRDTRKLAPFLTLTSQLFRWTKFKIVANIRTFQIRNRNIVPLVKVSLAIQEIL